MALLVWLTSGWIGGIWSAPRDSFKNEPIFAFIMVLIVGGFLGPFAFLPRIIEPDE